MQWTRIAEFFEKEAQRKERVQECSQGEGGQMGCTGRASSSQEKTRPAPGDKDVRAKRQGTEAATRCLAVAQGVGDLEGSRGRWSMVLIVEHAGKTGSTDD